MGHGDQMSAEGRQEGGDHYTSMAIQPARYCHANGIGKLEGDAIGYISRWRRKGGLQDLRKAIHTLELLIQYETEAGA